MLEEPLLRVENLQVGYGPRSSCIVAVRGLSFDLNRREVVALVGESGSGKSTTGLALLGLLEPEVASVDGAVSLTFKSGKSSDIARLSERQWRSVRGNDIAMIFQAPMSSLNPIYTIGHQIVESLRVHRAVSRKEARGEALQLLKRVGVPSPEQCLISYPHQLSGGMRQRVMIVMALSGKPSLLIADEPTTALDLTIQAQIIDLLREVQRDTQMSILFITHDLGLVADIAQRVIVMYAGQIIEEGPVNEVFANPRMPYTRALLNSRPRLGGKAHIKAIPGTVPSIINLPKGCSFSPRCAHFEVGRCDQANPELEEVAPGWKVRCIRWKEVEGERT